MLRIIFAFLFVMSISSAAAFAQDENRPSGPERMQCELTMMFGQTPSYMGVQTRDVTAENYAGLGLSSPRGVAVDSVMKDSPAEKAGLKAGDVILKYNGESVTSAQKLSRQVSETAPDQKARITVFRGGTEMELDVIIGRRSGGNMWTLPMEMPDGQRSFEFRVPDLDALRSMESFPMPGGDGDVFVWRSAGSRQIGIGVTPLTKQLAEHFGVESGVMINNVREASPAERSGLRAGDIIIEIDGVKVENEMQVVRAISGKREGDIVLTVMRQGNRISFTVTPEAVPGNEPPRLERNFGMPLPSEPLFPRRTAERRNIL
ncbi:MAG TPA: PDZ domain-containing protein [Pyrinomonadaceae bacterium]|nr:PDZ domain-containing protein [Pyrinomonadaceae bacterium]HMP64680.1 PDZ domain-containing protein [Pyrinomonadaceae bacterium]